MRPAATSPLPYSAFPAISMAVRKPDRSIAAACSTVAAEGKGGFGRAGGAAVAPPSLQATSAGTINVAIWPGAVRAAMIASTASRPTSDEEADVRNHFE